MDFTERAVLRGDAYGDASKLKSRQRLWSFVDRTWQTGRIYSVLDLTGTETIVDIGCGNGRDLVALRNDGHLGTIVGVDFSAGMLAAVPPGTAIQVNGDAVVLPIASRSIDVVCAMHMLYHVPDIPGALREARRIMRPSGAFVCSTNSTHAMPELVGPWSDAMTSVGGPPLERQSHEVFSVEAAGPMLEEVFSTVELHEIEMVARVPDASVVRDYVASTADLYRSRLPDPTRWDEVLDQVGDHAQRIIEANGTFDITQRAGIFVCH